MKKIFAVLLVMLMTMSTFCVYGADYTKVFDSLSNTIYSGELELEMKVELNKPLLLTDIINSYLIGSDVPVDIKLMLEGLAKSTVKANCTYEISEDMKKADMALSFQVSAPLEINENLKLDSWSKWDMWINYDFISDVPVYRVIYKMPFSTKYIVTDLSDSVKASGLDIQSVMPNATKTEELQALIMESYKKNSTVSKAGGGYRIKIDDAGFKNIIFDIFGSSVEIIKEQSMIMSMPVGEVDEATAAIEEAREIFNTKKDLFSVLGKDGLTIDLKINPFGYITEQKTKLNIGFNIYDIMLAFDALEDAEEAGITKENSDVDFTIEAIQKISKHNQKIKVEYPMLTEENSYDVSSTEEAEVYVSKYNYFTIAEEEMPVVIGSVPYVKIRSVAEKCPFELAYENGTVYVNTNSSNGIVEIKANTNEIVKNGEKIQVADMAVEIDGYVYVSNEILSYMNVEVSDFNYNTDTNETYAHGCYEDPDFVEEDIYFEEVTTEMVMSEYYWVDGDGRAPLIENGVIYIPFYPLMGEQNVATEEISIANGEIMVQCDDAFGFNNIKLYENSVFAEKDGEKILLENPVKFARNEYWVGTDFADKVLLSQLTSIYFSEYGSSYNFERYEK